MDSNQKFTTFFIYANVWCPRRSLDASKLFSYFIANDLKPAFYPGRADLIVIFTCGVFSINEESSILTVEKSLQNKSAKTVVTGCLLKINPEVLKAYSMAIIITPDNLGSFDSLIHAKVLYAQIPNITNFKGIHDLNRGDLFGRIKSELELIDILPNPLDKYTRRKFSKRSIDLVLAPSTYKIEIARGCLGDCSYCAIKQASEAFHSFPEKQILESFKSGLTKGYKDFVMLAADIGCYGVDINTNLPQLLSKLFSEEGSYNLILWDLNVRWFIKYYLDFRSVLQANSKKISMIVLPVESGSNKILGLMNRKYEIEKVKECILDLHKAIPDLKVETHIIVGFPGEAEADFQKSVDLIRELPFFNVVVFKYEERPKTKSLSLPGKVPKKVIDKRAKILAREAKVRILQ